MKKRVIFIIAVILVLAIAFSIYYISTKNTKTIDITTYDEPQQSYELKNEKVEPKSFTAIVPIFMYHFVTDEDVDALDIENYMTTAKLEEQLKYIKENNYEPVYISEFHELYKYTKPVAITIDDGFYFYDTAFPLFKKYNIKATLSIITNYINGPNYLTTEQIEEIVASGIIKVESHTLSHNKLATLSDDEMKKEINESYNYIKTNFNTVPDVLCYPIGSYNKKTIEYAKENYKFGLKMDGGVYNSSINNDYEIPRIYANRSMSMTTYINYLGKSKVDVEW